MSWWFELCEKSCREGWMDDVTKHCDCWDKIKDEFLEESGFYEDIIEEYGNIYEEDG